MLRSAWQITGRMGILLEENDFNWRETINDISVSFLGERCGMGDLWRKWSEHEYHNYNNMIIATWIWKQDCRIPQICHKLEKKEVFWDGTNRKHGSGTIDI